MSRVHLPLAVRRTLRLNGHRHLLELRTGTELREGWDPGQWRVGVAI